MRFSVMSPPFPGFDSESECNVTVSYSNIYANNILIDWKSICEEHQFNLNPKLERFDVSYNDDGSIRDLHFKIISEKEKGFNHYWIQLVSSRKKYLIASSYVDRCNYYNELISIRDFFLLWSQLSLREMKPKGDFEWYEFSFYGGKEPYAMEESRKFFIKDHQLISFGNDKLPVTGFYISSFGMQRMNDSTQVEIFEGREYQDYFFGVNES